MGEKLLPCPFCGSPAERKGNRRYRKGYAATIGCTSQRCPAKIEQATLRGTVEDAYIHAENVWNRRAQPANEPLTLDEMNALDHEPIYILHTGGKWAMNGWHIATASSYQNHGRCDLEIDNGNTIIDTQNYGKTWLAYRRPPERSENE